MNSQFSYNGAVTLTTKIGEKLLTKKYYNNGTDSLFTFYAMSLAGIQAPKMLPAFIRFKLGGKDMLRRGKIGIIKEFLIHEDLGPITRLTASLSKELFQSIPDGADTSTIKIILENSLEPTSSIDTKNELAIIELDTPETQSFGNIIKSITPGSQLIINWDLQVTNNGGN